MNKRIRMGNDEFILYVRKHNKQCSLSTNILGKLICEWLKEKANLKECDIQHDVDCLWGKNADNVSNDLLPYKASQFVFDRDCLPSLYDYLDSL